MSKPKVILENHQEVYDYYRSYKPPKKLAKVGHVAMATFFRANVHYIGDAKEAIADMLPRGIRMVLAANHSSVNDQYVIAGMAQSERELRPMRGNTFIPSKVELFDESGLRHTALRHGVDIMGAIPVFRPSTTFSKGTPPSTETVALQDEATSALLDLATTKIDEGQNMAIFPEGTRNKTEPRHLQKLKDGIGRIVCATSPITPVAILPVGISYGEDSQHYSMSPEVVIGEPMMRQFDDPEHLVNVLEPRMQQALDLAFTQTDIR